MNRVLIKDTGREQGQEEEEGAQVLNANKQEETESARAEEKATMSREKGQIFKKVFVSFTKRTLPQPFDFDHRQFRLKPDRCAGGCRQKSSLCVVFFLWLQRREDRELSLHFLYFFFVVLLRVFVVMAAGDRVQCGRWQNALCMWR